VELFRLLNREFGTAILYISHDLGTVARLCHSVAVLREGRIVDYGPVERIFPGSAGIFPENAHGVPRSDTNSAAQVLNKALMLA